MAVWIAAAYPSTACAPATAYLPLKTANGTSVMPSARRRDGEATWLSPRG
jgi:hypothetical protein